MENLQQQLAIELSKQALCDVSSWIESLLDTEWIAKWEYYGELTKLTETDPDIRKFEELLEDNDFIKEESGWFHSEYGQFGDDATLVCYQMQDLISTDSLYEKSGAETVEYWIVGEDLANKLKENEEKVVQIGAVYVWARTETGAVYTDTVIRAIASKNFS